MFELDLLLFAVSLGLSLHLIDYNVISLIKSEKHLIASFHSAQLARISITTQNLKHLCDY